MANKDNQDREVSTLDELEMFQADETARDGTTDVGHVEDVDDALSYIEEELHEAEGVLGQEGLQQPVTSRRHGGGGNRPRSSEKSGGALLLVMGLVVLAAGLALCGASLAGAADSVLQTMGRAGLSPANVLLLGAVITGIASLRRRHFSMSYRVEDMEGLLLDSEGFQSSLDYLVEAQEHSLERQPASGEELDRVLAVLQRQDDKVNNLTKALKMYGKPLLEISKQLNEMARKIDCGNDNIQNMQAATLLTGEAIQGMQDKTGSDPDSDLYSMLREVRREISGVATSISRIGTGKAVNKATPATSTSTTSQPAPANADTAANDAPVAGGALAHSISGTKRSAGKGVLGSIQKLRKMKK